MVFHTAEIPAATAAIKAALAEFKSTILAADKAKAAKNPCTKVLNARTMISLLNTSFYLFVPFETSF